MDVDFPWTKERSWKRTGRYGRVSWHWLALCFPRCHVCHFIDVFRVTNDRSFRQNVYVTRRNGFWQQGLEGKKKIRTSCIVENVPLEKIGPLWEEDGRNDARGKNEVKVGKGIYGGGTERRHGWERKNTEEHRFRCNASYVILLSVNRSRVFRPDINISASQSRPSTFVKEGRLFVKYVTAILCHSSLLFLRPRLLRTIRDIIHDIPMQRI